MAQVSGFTVLTSVLAFGALFGLIGAVIGVAMRPGSGFSWTSSPRPEELASPPRTPRSSSSSPDAESRNTDDDGSHT